MHRPMFLAMALILGIAFSTLQAWSTSLIFTVTPVGGNFDYNFTLTNDTGASIYELFLEVPLSSWNLLSFSSPGGWGDGFGGDQPYYGPVLVDSSFVDWWASFGSELGNGMSLGGFEFVSASQISDPIKFSVNADPSIVGIATGVPEPTSLLLLGTGLGGLALTKLSRR